MAMRMRQRARASLSTGGAGGATRAFAEAESGGGPHTTAPGGESGTSPATRSATLSLSGAGDQDYHDTDTTSEKTARMNVIWRGGEHTDYIIVQWLRGYMKDENGHPYPVMMYGQRTDFDFADWQVDSRDVDPAYQSTPSTRWRYTVDGPDSFHATDTPGPAGSWRAGAEARIDFRTAVYLSEDVPPASSGTISATPITPFSTWSFRVHALGNGRYSHE